MGKKKVKKIFNNISVKYDVTNAIISLGIEKYWRFRFNSFINGREKIIMDACCGTGTSSFEIWEKTKRNSLLYGLDISEEMLKVARGKLNKIKNKHKKIEGEILFKKADIENTGFPDNYFDLITIIFGIRNINNRQKVLKELRRISKKGARLLCMEFNYPPIKLFRRFYNFYLDRILIKFGSIMTKNKDAYIHLVKSIKDFPQPLTFKKLLENSGWKVVSINTYTLKTCVIYEAGKNKNNNNLKKTYFNIEKP